MKKLIGVVIFCIFGTAVYSQNKPIETVLEIDKTFSKISVDGVLDENVWSETDVAKDFYLVYPVDNDFPISKTEVKVVFDDDFLYFGIVCQDPTPGKYIVESLKRDWDWRATENVSIYIDPFDDRTNGFNFSVSPYNAQREGLISAGADVTSDWDNKWYSEVTNFDDKWVVEIAIPFKTLRYKSNLTNWNIQFLRNDVKNNERSAWMAVPQQIRSNNLAFAGQMSWKSPPPEPKMNVSIIPYVLGSTARNHEEGEDVKTNGNVGFDAKIAVSSSLNLDLTVNPDFSQVEVDQQVVNLQRFELFFPEKRQFFIENSDLFAKAGFPPSRPFFSRRIGIAQDTSGNSVEVPILYGARLSGKINKDWRIGLMNMQTGEQNNIVLPGSENLNDGYNLSGQNYTAAVIQRQLWSRSNIGAIFVNRQSTNYNPEDSTNSTSAYNRVVGVDFNFATLDDKWRANLYLHGSSDPIAKKNAIAQGTFVQYQSRHWRVNYFHNYVGEGYNAELGFVPRTGTFSAGTLNSKFIIYSESPSVVTIEPGVRVAYTFTAGGQIADADNAVNVEVAFNNTSRLQADIVQNYTFLLDEFDPTNSDGVPLKAGSEYTWYGAEIRYNSDARKKVSYNIGGQYGGFYNGVKFSAVGNIGYKFRPYGSFFVSVAFNDVQLPAPYSSKNFWLIGPRLDLTFTNNLFLTTFVQYNEQAENLNINARFQWRFAPVSDLFVVYTDNYLPTDFTVKNRAIVVKFSYWLNL